MTNVTRSTKAIGRIDEVTHIDAATGEIRFEACIVPRGAVLAIRGWGALAENLGGTAGMFATLDDGSPLELIYGIERPDVAAALNDDSFAFTGFRGVLSTAHLELGPHELAVAIRDDEGTFVALEEPATFVIEETLDQKMIEGPASGEVSPIFVDELMIGERSVAEPVSASQKDFVIIKGWAFDGPAAAVASNVYAVVGSTVVSGQYGNPREDVAAHHANPSLLNCGFSVAVPLDALAPGERSIRLRVLGADGRTVYDGRSIAVDVAPFASGNSLAPGGEPTLGVFDTAIVFDALGNVVTNLGALQLTRGDQLLVGGWAIDEPGDTLARSVHVCVDDVSWTPAIYGIERRDVARHFHRPDLTDCGFTALLPTAAISTGPHTAYLRVMDRSGRRFYDAGQRLEFLVTETLGDS